MPPVPEAVIYWLLRIPGHETERDGLYDCDVQPVDATLYLKGKRWSVLR